MKTIKTIKLIITGIFLFLCSFGLMAQVGPPDPPGGHGEEEDQPAGGGAPLDGGLFILLGLGAAYSGKKVYSLKKKK